MEFNALSGMKKLIKSHSLFVTQVNEVEAVMKANFRKAVFQR